MKNIVGIEKNSLNFSVKRNSLKEEPRNNIPISLMDDFQTSISNFSTRTDSYINRNHQEKKTVKFNPLITVINIENIKKKKNGEINENDLLNEHEQKCFICSIF